MSSRPRRSAAEKAKPNADPATDHRNVIEMIKGITGASAEDVELVLKDCGGNADEATARLIEDPSLIFSQVQSKKEKKKKRDEERKVLPQVSDSLESLPRGGHSSRGRGRGRGRDDRGGRGYGRSNDRSTDRGPRSHPANSEQPSSVDVRFDSHPDHTNEKVGAGWGPSTSDRDADPATQHGGNSWGPTSTSKPSGGWDNVAEDGTGGGASWDAVVEEPQNSRQQTAWGAQDAESVAPPTNSIQQPIGTQPGPAPIKPPNTGTQVRSMADLFKQKPASVAPVQQPSVPVQSQPPAAKAAPSPQKAGPSAAAAAPGVSAQSPGTPKSALDSHNAEEQQNGWGPNTSDQKIEMQSDSLGGGYVGGHKSVQPPPGIIASSAPPTSLPPVDRSQNSTSISNQGWQQPEEPRRQSTDTWGGSHSNAGLGGLGLDSGLHHSYLGDPQSSWLNSSQASQPQSLGNAMLSSLSQPVTSQPSEHHSIAPSHAQDLVSNNSGYHTSGVGQAISQRLPSNQAGQMQFGDFSQFSNLDLGESKSEALKPPPAAHYSTAFSQSKLPNLQTSAASDIKATPFMQPNASSSSTPQGYNGQSLDHQTLSQQQAGHSNSQQAQHQRAVNAFNAASQPQTVGSQKATPTASTAPESAANNSQALYSNQGYQTGTSYAQYQYPQQNNAYYNSYQQEPESTLGQGTETGQGTATHSKLGAASTASSVSYDPAGYSSYNQPGSQRESVQAQAPRELSQAAAEFQPPTHNKYGNSSSGSLAAAGGHGSLAAGGHNNHSAAAVLSQQQGLSQMGQGYGSQLPQNFYSQTQQYAFPQYNTYTQASTGYGAGYGAGYQQQGQFAPGGYSQAGKYGGGYGGAGGYQHSGYGLDKKDQQLGHGLYGQQQVPLAGRQHYGAGGAQDAYGYQAQNQAYRGYGQYGQFYGQNQ